MPRLRQHHIVGCLLATIVLTLYLGFSHTFVDSSEQFQQRPFRLHPPLNVEVDITRFQDIPAAVAQLKHAQGYFHRIYNLTVNHGTLEIPTQFKAKVKRMFEACLGNTNDLEFVQKQQVVVLYNKFTFEETLFNALRGCRPGYAAALPPEKEEELRTLLLKSQEECDFCKVNMTARDPWPQVHSKLCYVASNVAKYQGFHSLIVPKKHITLDISLELVQDLLQTANRWFDVVYKHDATMAYPHVMWDNLPRASASQWHLHWQASVSPSHYYGRVHQVREGAIRYEKLYNSIFWADVVAVHEAMGLAVRYEDAVALAYITPTKEKEVVIISRYGRAPAFGTLFYVALQAFLQNLNVRAISCGISFEPRDPAVSPYPAIARLVDRGSPFDVRNDVGAMEFFGAYNVASDPFRVAEALRSQLKKTAR